MSRGHPAVFPTDGHQAVMHLASRLALAVLPGVNLVLRAGFRPAYVIPLVSSRLHAGLLFASRRAAGVWENGSGSRVPVIHSRFADRGYRQRGSAA